VLFLLFLLVGPGEIPAHLGEAVAHADRPAADKERDADRKPAEVMAFFEIEPGDRVAELMAGTGYYAELLARAVGSEGKVYAQNNRFVLERFAEKGLSERLARKGLEHVARWDRELDDLELPEGLDAVIMVLFYHDTYWQEVDRAKMNAAVFAALKPGGVFGIVDHRAEDGSGDRDVRTIHRVDEALVREEILAAGFVLDAASAVLHHPEDDRTANVFSPEIRGKTDRFVLRFRKPLR